MAASPSFGQTAAKGPVNPCHPSLKQSKTTICQGGTATLTVINDCFAGPYTYEWSPSQDISSNTDRVVVNPLVTTTYTVKATSPNAPTINFSATVTVVANCCQRPGPSSDIVELNNEYVYDAPGLPNHNDPFQSYPSGTTFHVTGPLTLRSQFLLPNSSLAARFVMPPGTVLLMDAGASVYVQQGARLEMNGSTITATCNDMWGGLHIAGTSDQLDMHGVSFTGVPGTANMRNRIMHSQQGIVLEDGGPEFQINFTDFLHNLNSLDIDRRTTPYPHYTHSNGAVYNQVNYSTFDSNPNLMKAPYHQSSGQYYYTDTHVRVAGDVRGTYPDLGFSDNTLSNCLFGIKADRTTTKLRIVNSTFDNFLLAGIHYGSLTGALTPIAGANELIVGQDYNGNPARCYFNFRPYSALPTTAQATNAYNQYAASLPYGTAGISTMVAPTLDVTARYTNFLQSSPGDYALPAALGQVGISATRLNDVGECGFLSMRVGVAHDLVANSMTDHITASGFYGCGYGYLISNTFSAGGTSRPNAGRVVLDCNTFSLNNNSAPSSSGPYYGVYAAANAYAQTAGLLAITSRNLFTGIFPNRFYAIYNSNLNYYLFYHTFSGYATDYNNASFRTLVYDDGPAQQSGFNCLPFTNSGIHRSSSTRSDGRPSEVAKLEQNMPNPAQGSTTISYQLGSGTLEAQLLVRRSTDGRLLTTQALSLQANSYELSLQPYSAGTYFYTLVADGVPVATKRLVVQ